MTPEQQMVIRGWDGCEEFKMQPVVVVEYPPSYAALVESIVPEEQKRMEK